VSRHIVGSVHIEIDTGCGSIILTNGMNGSPSSNGCIPPSPPASPLPVFALHVQMIAEIVHRIESDDVFRHGLWLNLKKPPDVSNASSGKVPEIGRSRSSELA
jgi:hypothetical protein